MMKQTKATSWITSTLSAWSEGGRISRDTQGNEVVLATPSPPPLGDGLEALGAGDETQLGDYYEEEEDAAVANIPAMAPPPFDSSAAASAAATTSSTGSSRVLLKHVERWADIPHEDGAILHVMLNIINGHGPRVYTKPGMHARAAKGEKMDGTVNVQFFCQKLATVNANLHHNGQDFTFGLNKGTAARTVLIQQGEDHGKTGDECPDVDPYAPPASSPWPTQR
jgi:hypothetical protein